MTGSEGITLYDDAGQLSLLTGRPISYHEETPEEARASRARSGALDWEIEGWVASYAAIAAGEMDVVSDTVTRLTGHEPQPPRVSAPAPGALPAPAHRLERLAVRHPQGQKPTADRFRRLRPPSAVRRRCSG